MVLFAAPIARAVQRDDREPRERVRDDWRRPALETLRVASSERLINDVGDLAIYRSAGFNALVVFDVNGYDTTGTSWDYKAEAQVREETAFARAQNMPLIIGLAVEPHAAAVTSASESARRPLTFAPQLRASNAVIPAATDDEIVSRIALWKHYGDDIVLGVFPWYDDVFWQNVEVDRQRHVYGIIKNVARDWYVFGMIGDFGFNASDADVARFYDPAAFDHLILLMYPYNVGGTVTGFPLDNVASRDPDGDIARYVDRYIDRMTEKFFSRLGPRQLVLLVVQAFYYVDEPDGHKPRAGDIDIMARRGSERLRTVAGQERNFSTAYFYWGGEPAIVGIAQRPDWSGVIAGVNADLDRGWRDRSPRQH